MPSEDGRLRALVVDDDRIARMALQEILRVYGEVHASADGSEAVAACRSALEAGTPYDLVCLDVHMPVMDGIDALRLIRREEQRRGRFRPCATKVVIATAADDIATINQAFRELSDAYVVKPIDAGELLDILRCWFPVA